MSSGRQGMPAAHPDSAFSQLQANWRLSREGPPPPTSSRSPYYMAAAATAPPTSPSFTPTSPSAYAEAYAATQDQPYWRPDPAYQLPQSNVIPGANNFAAVAATGAVVDTAYHPAPEHNPTESGVEACEATRSGPRTDAFPSQSSQRSSRPSSIAYMGGAATLIDRDSRSSLQALNAAAVPMGQSLPGYHAASTRAFIASPYSDDPYPGLSTHSHQNLAAIDPDEIYDDGDDGLEYGRGAGRSSMLSLGHSNSPGGHKAPPAAAAFGGAVASGGVMGALGGLMGRGAATRDGAGEYDAMRSGSIGYANAGGGGSTYDLALGGREKSAWLAKQGASARRWRWMIAGGIFLVIAIAIALGVYFGVVRNRRSSSSASSAGQSAADDTAKYGDLTINSPEIQKLMNNANLHKVFPGIDYTPINTQYPDCVRNPPSQNNVTRDLAILSQLTSTVRLYGTDCNQTQMLIHAVNQLQLNDTMKIWMGVWQDNNKTTNARQLSQMWDILDQYGETPFKGLIVANEILFREQMTVTELATLLSDVRTNLTSKGMSLPVATSDLGDDWTAELAQASDYIMSNIHPFFGGVNANMAASWTYSFWANKNGAIFKSDTSKNIIAETGWPSQGGTDCGTTDVTNCPDAAVAGIDQLNQFLSDWVCQALANGTQYFWFESFDEPWKIVYNTADQNWEDHWGLMDVNRNLKSGVTIPDCGGKTVG